MKFEFSFNLLTPENFRLLSEGRIVRLKINFFFLKQNDHQWNICGRRNWLTANVVTWRRMVLWFR